MTSTIQEKDRIGPDRNYEVISSIESAPHQWIVKSQDENLMMRTMQIPLPLATSADRIRREQNRLSREASRWRGALPGRPELVDLFWEKRTFCWVERRIAGAPLSSLESPLTLAEALCLLEEGLMILHQLHAERDFKSGEPLLHLSIRPEFIWRGEDGGLYFLNPLTPTWIELKAQLSKRALDGLDGCEAPELTRGRSGVSTDLYSFGMSVLSSLSGLTPKRVDDRLQAGCFFSHDLSLPDEVEPFLTQLTAFRASARFASAQSALVALRRLPESLRIDLPPPLELDVSTSPNSPHSSTQTSSTQTSSTQTSSTQTSSTHNEPVQESPINDGEESPKRSTSSTSLVPVIQDVQDATIPSFYTRPREIYGGEEGADPIGVVHGQPVLESAFSRPLLIALGVIAVLMCGYLWGRAQDSSLHPSPSNTHLITLTRGGAPASLSAQDSLSPKPTATPIEVTPKELAHQVQWIMIPAGEVLIGSLKGEGYENEKPQRRVKVDTFKISKSEVTVLQYAQCVAQDACSIKGLRETAWGDLNLCNWNQVGREDHPINCISWAQARDFARWAHGRLLSEVEWSHAAQGGEARRMYPWGEAPASCDRAVLADFIKGPGCGQGHTAPVCSKRRGHTIQGVCDMVGNVWEWVMDEAHESYEDAPMDSAPWVSADPILWDSVRRVYRGGGAFDERDLPRIARRGFRDPHDRLHTLGFRVARSVDPSPKKASTTARPRFQSGAAMEALRGTLDTPLGGAKRALAGVEVSPNDGAAEAGGALDVQDGVPPRTGAVDLSVKGGFEPLTD